MTKTYFNFIPIFHTFWSMKLIIHQYKDQIYLKYTFLYNQNCTEEKLGYFDLWN